MIVVVLEGFTFAPIAREITIAFGITERAIGGVLFHNKPRAVFIDKSVKREIAVIDFRNAIPVHGLALIRADAAATQAWLDCG